MKPNKDDDYMARLSRTLDEQGIAKGDPAEHAANARMEARKAEQAKELLDREEGAASSGSPTDKNTDDSSQAQAAREAENNPAAPPADSDYVNNFTGKGKQKAKGTLPNFGGKIPLIATGSGLGLGSVLLLVFLVPGILFFHLLANMFDTYDPSATALSQVAKIVLLNKLGANDATQGSCSTIKIACRLKTPTNALLRQLNDVGITALDAKGNEIPLSDKKWASQRPTSYRVSSFYSSTGDSLVIQAKDLKGALQNNTEFRIAFNKIVKRIGVRAFSRFSPAFLKVMENFRFNLRDSLSEKSRVSEAGKRTVSEILSESIVLKSGAGQAIAGAKEAASSIAANIALRVNKLLTLVGKTGKGSGIVLAMALQCMANEIPGMVRKTMISMQQTGIVSAGAPVITAMSAIQAGDGDQETATEIGNLWTEQNEEGKSALDSVGVGYGLYHDKNIADDPTYQNVTPSAFGDGLVALDIADKIMSNPVSDAGCAALMNPVSGAAIAAGINVAVAGSGSITFGASFAINLVLGVGMTAVIDTFSDGISEVVSEFIAPGLGDIAQPTLDKLDEPGQSRGNVLSSAFGILGSNNGANTFGTAMTTSELSAYSDAMRAEEIASAEIDRATLSPFDPTSRYTFVGSMVNQLVPYYSSLSSVSGGLSVMFNLVPLSFGSIVSSVGAADSPADIYSNACPDPEAVDVVNKDETLAADIFCNPVYAMNISDNWNPNSTVNDMLDMDGAINEEGEAIVDDSVLGTIVEDTFKFTEDITVIKDQENLSLDYSDWLDTCTLPENATQCTGETTTEETYGLYTAARTVGAMLDMDGTDNGDPEAQSLVFDEQEIEVDSLAVTSESTDASQGVKDVFGIFSTFFDLFRSYTSSVFSSVSTTNSLTDLMRFSLWR